MNKIFKCPFCETVFNLQKHITYNFVEISKTNIFIDYTNLLDLRLELFECPMCEKYSVVINFLSPKFEGKPSTMVFPDSKAKKFPDYVPEQIRNDYTEAFKILDLSPKASATLSRRCIQGMIHDEWEIKEENLYKEIDALKGKIDPQIFEAIHALRQLGNIGAHMEKDINLIVDIEPNEAEKLIKLVELLIKDWYIDPHNNEELFKEIVDINEVKQEQRKLGENS